MSEDTIFQRRVPANDLFQRNTPVQPIPFLFDGDALVRIVDLDDNPWFLVQDIQKILALTNSAQMLAMLPDDEKGTVYITRTDVCRGTPKRLVVSESGMYALILRSNDAMKPGTRAFKFRRWVTAELLPMLRKTGHYEMPHIEPKPRELSIPQRRHLVNSAHRLGGAQAGIELWNKLGLPELDAFKEIMRQGRFNFVKDLDETPAPPASYMN